MNKKTLVKLCQRGIVVCENAIGEMNKNDLSENDKQDISTLLLNTKAFFTQALACIDRKDPVGIGSNIGLALSNLHLAERSFNALNINIRPAFDMFTDVSSTLSMFVQEAIPITNPNNVTISISKSSNLENTIKRIFGGRKQ